MKKTIFIILTFIRLLTYGQLVNDSIRHDSASIVTMNIEFLYQLLLDDSESFLEDDIDAVSDHEDGYEELLEEYQYHQENPININGEEVRLLAELGLINGFQLEALRLYRERYGTLLFIEELFMLDDFNEHTVAVIAPIVYCGKSEWEHERDRITPGKLLSQGKHQVTVNYAQKFPSFDDEGYLGGPLKLQIKYSYHYKHRFRFGFAMENDAGEPFLFNGLDDSIKDIVRKCRSPGFDFYGFHLYGSDIAIMQKARQGFGKGLIIKDMAIGDYLLCFGQGLTLWTGMSFGKTTEGCSVMKRAAGIKPKTSSGEGKFFRGAATTLKYGDFNATYFFSNRHVDATISLADSLVEAELVSALQESGYHRTLNEISKRNNLRQTVFGGHLAYAGPQFEIGYTACHVRLGAELQLKPSKYNQFYFQGDRLTNMGCDFHWFLKNFAFFGELSRSDNGAYAGLIGMNAKPKGYINFSFLYRNYGKRYQNLFFGALSESSRGQAEEGFYLGLQCAPIPGWEVTFHADYFRLKWLTSQVYNPSWGREYSMKIDHQISRNASLQLRFKSKTRMKNSIDDHEFSYYPVSYTKNTVNIQLDYMVLNGFHFANKVSYAHYANDDGADSRGYFVCQDIAFKPTGKPYALTFRYALFDSDDYYSRISTYENDVLGAFSIPSLNGLGTRVYILGKIKLFNTLSIYSRVGYTFVEDETKTDLKIELIWKP